MTCQLTFPAKADMGSVSALREDWLSKMDGHSHIHINCARVEVMTAAAAQLVVALARMLNATRGEVVLTQVPEALREDLRLLGLTDYLKEPAHHD
jgi:anti-anti-sigma regulatory factor